MHNIYYLFETSRVCDSKAIHAYKVSKGSVSISFRQNGYVEILDLRVVDPANGSREALPAILTEGFVGEQVADIIYKAICFSDVATGEETLKRPTTPFAQFSRKVDIPFLHFLDAQDQPQIITALKVTSVKQGALSLAA